MNHSPTLTKHTGRSAAASLLLLPLILLSLALVSCRSPQSYREEADTVAYENVQDAQQAALGRTEPFTINTPADTLRRRLLLGQNLPMTSPASLGTRDLEPIPQWPNDNYLDRPDPDIIDPVIEGQTPGVVRLSLVEALQVAAYNSRDFQSEKEQVFRTALALDLEEDQFRNTWAGLVSGLLSHNRTGDDPVTAAAGSSELALTRQFRSGAIITGAIAMDLVKLLTQGRSESLGLRSDITLSIPLLRGSGEFVVTEPLTQAQRDTIYAIYDFERFKRVFAVRVASDYLGVLQQLDQVRNAEENYRGLIASTRRARRLADAGRLPEIQVDQAWQDELRARNRWISARENYARRLDSFKTLLGLPTDALIELDPQELERLSASLDDMLALPAAPEDAEPAPPADAPIELQEPDRQDAGPLELDALDAVQIALDHRLDLRTAVGQVFDAQRGVAVAADLLRADARLLGTAAAGERRSIGSATADDARLRPERGSYSVLLDIDLPLERTAERNVYRNSLIELERAVRGAQALEDQVKLEIRNALRELLEARQTMRIQAESLRVARRRVESTSLFLQAGRAEIRDVLEAQEALISAQNALTSAVVAYRVAEWRMQRDLGVLQVNEAGLWEEWTPDRRLPGQQGEDETSNHAEHARQDEQDDHAT